MNIREEILRLNLPVNSYVVVGSGIMHALGIRESDDIDMIVSEEVYDSLDREGWAHDSWPDQVVLRRGHFDIGLHWMGETVSDLLQKSTTVNDISYLSLDSLLEWKRSKARPKDLVDVERILEYKARLGA